MMTTAPSHEGGGRHPDAALGGPDGHPRSGVGASIHRDTSIYGAVENSDHFTTDPGALVSEDTTIGDNVLVGTHAVTPSRNTASERLATSRTPHSIQRRL